MKMDETLNKVSSSVGVLYTVYLCVAELEPFKTKLFWLESFKTTLFWLEPFKTKLFWLEPES